MLLLVLPRHLLGESLASLFSRAIKMMDTQKIIKTYDYQPDWRATLVVEKRFTRHSQWLFCDRIWSVSYRCLVSI